MTENCYISFSDRNQDLGIEEDAIDAGAVIDNTETIQG